MSDAQAHDRSKRHSTFTSTTEQRIRFREVQLRPKMPDTPADAIGVPSEEQETAAEGVMDRMTGKDTTTPAKTRKKKAAAGEKAPRRKSTRKGKGKAKAVEGEDEEEANAVVDDVDQLESNVV